MLLNLLMLKDILFYSYGNTWSYHGPNESGNRCFGETIARQTPKVNGFAGGVHRKLSFLTDLSLVL